LKFKLRPYISGRLQGIADGLDSVFFFDTRTGEIAAATKFTHHIPDWITVKGSVGFSKGADGGACVPLGVQVELAADIRTPILNANASIVGKFTSCGQTTVYDIKTYPPFSAALNSGGDGMHLAIKDVVLHLEGTRPPGMDLNKSGPDFDKLSWRMSGRGNVKIEAGRLLPTHLDGHVDFDAEYLPTRVVDGVELDAQLVVNSIVVELHMSFTAGPRDNPNVYIIGNTTFKYPAGKGAQLDVNGTVQLALKDVCDIKLAMRATALVGASGTDPVFSFSARNVGAMTLKGIEVTDFRVDANVYIHTGATPAYAVAGSLKATASVGTMSAAAAAAAGLGLSPTGTLQISFNTRYSLQLSILTSFVIKEGSFQIEASVGVSIGTCPREGNFIEGTITIKLSETQAGTSTREFPFQLTRV